MANTSDPIRPFPRVRRYKLLWALLAEAAAGLAISALFLPGGQDLYVYYRPFALGCLSCGFVPYYALWALWPLRLLDYPYLWPVWTAMSAGGLLWLSRYTRVNPAWLFLSFPFFGQLWLGQIDVLIALGLAVALLAPNPYARGVGAALALVKPQLTLFALVYLFFSEPPQARLKILAAPVAMIVASLVVFGPLWPVTWVTDTVATIPKHVWRLAASDTWRFAFPLLLVPLSLPRRRDRFNAALLASTFATPFYSVYSYVVSLLFYNKWWAVPLSYAWLVIHPWLKTKSMRFAWILPLALLVSLVRETKDQNIVLARFRDWRAQRQLANL